MNSATTPISPKQPAKDKRLLLWHYIGIAALIFLGISGCVAIRKPNSAPNEQSTDISSPTIAPTQIAIEVVKQIQDYTPTFESTPCDFDTPAGAMVKCGFVIVPEDRTGDITDTVRIAVAVFQGATAKSDPILYLQGGPGAKAIEWSVSAYESIIAPLTQERDFIVFDPRGVGVSQPTLECDEFETTYLQDIQGKVPKSDKISYYQGALLACKNRFLAAGANVATYTSHDMATDAKDILVALGYKQANLYGISYGTRIAQFVMREYPKFVRSVILDSVVPVDVQLLNQSPEERDTSLQHLFDECASDADCSSAFPDLESVYNEVAKRLNAHPVTLEVHIDESRTIQQIVDGSTFHDILLWALRMPQTIELAPQLIYRSHEEDNLDLILTLALPLQTFDSISMGNYISVNCHDQVFAMSTEKLDNTIYELCQLWGSEPPLPDENDFVDSDLPTLIFDGRYDPITPPAFAKRLAEHLTHSYIAEFPYEGHAPSTSRESVCPVQIISAFLQDPGTPPNLACIVETQPIKFVVPYREDESLTFEPVRIEDYGVNTRIPSGWSDAKFGFYNRVTYFGDITQIGVQSAPVSESQWITWLSINFGGKRGLDQPIIQHDKQQANGLTWTIYQTDSQGYPVEIAFAKSGNQTLMVLLISHKDEHDGLYKRVFLPIIDATTLSK